MTVNINENEVMSLFYDVDENRFMDEFGSLIHDIFRLITPGQLMIFRKYKEVYLVRDRSNSFYVEMIYPDEESDMYHQYELGDGEWRGYDYHGKLY
jgi:hypothetical protein